MKLETIDNLSLIKNNIEHIEFELIKSEPSFFRIARESHQMLYRSMVEVLRGTANISITGKPKDIKRKVQYQFSNNPWVEIQKENIKGCRRAWRYSKPIECEEPKLNYNKSANSYSNDFLLGFYDLLAMIQTECFMHRYIMSNFVKVSNRKMKILEWLHENIRNEYEHFIPKLYSAPKYDLIHASIICCTLSKELIYKTNIIIFDFILKDLNVSISTVISKLKYFYKSSKESDVQE